MSFCTHYCPPIWQSKIVLMTLPEVAYLMIFVREVIWCSKDLKDDAMASLIGAEMQTIAELLPTREAEMDEVEEAAYKSEWAEFAKHNYIVPMKQPLPADVKAKIVTVEHKAVAGTLAAGPSKSPAKKKGGKK